MSEHWWQDLERDPVHARAAEWFVRLDDPQVSFEETLEWQKWMEEDPRHEAAFSRMEKLGKELRRVPRPQVEHDAEAHLTLASQRTQRGRRKMWVALAASAVLAAVVLSWTSFNADTQRTAVGQNRTIQLQDGSKVILGGDTRLKIRFSQEKRLIVLTQGEAFFTVAKEAARPFQVRAGEAAVTAVGTSFNVRRNDGRVTVSVAEGRVAVVSTYSPTRDSMPLDKGQRAAVSTRGVEVASTLPDTDITRDWQTGRFIFRSEPLRYVIEDINRYAGKPVTFEDGTIGELKFTGTVLNDNVPSWIASLNTVFGLEAIEEPQRIVLRRSRR